MKTKEYTSPETVVHDFLFDRDIMQTIIPGSENGGTGQLGNAATVKPFDDEEDEDYNHEVWDEEE